MRFNDRELAKLSEGKCDLEGVLTHRKPQGKDWYQQQPFKERVFKLISNLLFYYRVNEQEPLGVLVLENAQIAYESPHTGMNFAFSIQFKVNKSVDNDAKHIFSCRCQDDVNKWVSALKMASYEYWRSQLLILKTKLSMKTGKDPILNIMENKQLTTQSHKKEVKKTKVKNSSATFYSHVGSTFYQSSYSSTKTITQSNNIPIDTLIDL
ncbi:pleckstrin homology domain-containing family J member 1-like [Aethina tumida]|uniref:pleckstrin homology domain-containing family J member 1-like n=1 Tax=Aethina tumida TaxID=116153 RepID=UPI00096B12EC|nr:pleckstrin homology domain-containing family J member 1-like [Aethina tumida]